MTRDVDLLVIGGGPAGLCAAINGASEGLKTTLLDNGNSLGGQARESSAIENYPGFPDGITGDKLMGCFVNQAQRFNTDFVSPAMAVRLYRDGAKKRIIVTTDDYSDFTAKAVIIATGVQYRRLEAKGIGPLMGRGIFYGAPTFALSQGGARNVCVVGGANSAGQAAVRLASNPKNKVSMYIRKTLEAQMSQYLIDRIRNTPNIRVCEGCEVTEVEGREKLENVVVKTPTGDISEAMDCMFIFIGASPRTMWLESTLQLSSDRFILTGSDLNFEGSYIAGMEPLHMETSLPGVFAAGDVRDGSSKRVAVAAGEGAAALQMVHTWLAKGLC